MASAWAFVPSRSLACPQVVQFLLAKNYFLTALELLVETQAAGKDAEAAELKRFFSDPDRFPAEELARHQNANGDGKERLDHSCTPKLFSP